MCNWKKTNWHKLINIEQHKNEGSCIKRINMEKWNEKTTWKKLLKSLFPNISNFAYAKKLN